MESQQRAIRRTFGAFWMTVYGAAASSVVWWAIWPAPVQLFVWLAVVAGLIVAFAGQLRRLRRVPTSSTGRRPFDRMVARRIGFVIVAYSIAEGVAAFVLHFVGHDALIFPVAVAIAGIHFFVFARVLDTRQYYVTGGLDCVVAVGSVVLLSEASRVGLLSARVFVCLAGGGVALFVTAGLMLHESRAISLGDRRGSGA